MSVDNGFLEKIKTDADIAIRELLNISGIKKGEIFVVGCSSSEIVGERIGKGSSLDAAKAVFESIYPHLKEKGIFLAAQCCEHLNRALVIESECAEKFGYDTVCVRPQQHAGGSFAMTAYENFSNPVMVEHIRASAGIDIGGTLVGMHLRDVAVPVRLSVSKIGEANILCARTRPKYIGGSRAVYPD